MITQPIYCLSILLVCGVGPIERRRHLIFALDAVAKLRWCQIKHLLVPRIHQDIVIERLTTCAVDSVLAICLFEQLHRLIGQVLNAILRLPVDLFGEPLFPLQNRQLREVVRVLISLFQPIPGLLQYPKVDDYQR